MHRRLAVPAFLSAFALLAACDQSETTQEAETPTTSIVPLDRPVAAGMDSEVFREHLRQILESDDPTPSELQDTLSEFPKERLWSLLEWLDTSEEDEGKRVGLTVVVLSQLAKKDPARTTAYLTEDEFRFGLRHSSAALMAFRQALTQWSSEAPHDAWQALEAYQSDPELAAKIALLETMHGERVEVTLAGVMPLTDLKAITERWDLLELKEAARVLPRLLRRLETPTERENLIKQSADWLGQQWKDQGPGVIFEWAIGLGDDALQNEILSKMKDPTLDE